TTKSTRACSCSTGTRRPCVQQTNARLPDDEHDTAFRAGNAVSAVRTVYDERSCGIAAVLVGLRTVQHENVFETHVLMRGNTGAGLVVQQSSRRPDLAGLVEAANPDSLSKRLPARFVRQRAGALQ